MPQSSAIYTQHPYDKIDGTNSDIVKFKSTEAAGFQNLCRALRNFSVSDRARRMSTSGGEPQPSLSSSSTNEHIRHLHLPFQRNRNFIGRGDVLQRLKSLLFNEEFTTVALYGLGGVGKTQVANAFAHWTKEYKPSCSVFWVPALSMSSFQEAYEAIATELRLQKAENQDVKALVRDHLSAEDAGNWLLVLDNADDHKLVCGSDPPDYLQKYLPHGDHG